MRLAMLPSFKNFHSALQRLNDDQCQIQALGNPSTLSISFPHSYHSTHGLVT